MKTCACCRYWAAVRGDLCDACWADVHGDDDPLIESPNWDRDEP